MTLAHAPQQALFGRDSLVAAVRDALSRDPWITLKGPPGVGKTTLHRALRRAAPERQWLCVSARTARARPPLLAAIAAALEIDLRFTDPSTAFRAVADALDAARAVLVIDDADYALPQVVELVSDLIAVCEQLRVVVCAWRIAGVAAERVIDVEPLSVDSAVAMLRARVARRATDLRVNDDDARAIVERASRLPLAIELAASRVASLGVAATAENTGNPTLDESIESALAALGSPAARAALGALALFEEDFNGSDAEAIIGLRSLAPLEQLVEASLVQVVHDGDATRFRVLSVVRDFVVRTTRDLDARERYVRYWAALPRANTDETCRWNRVAAARADLVSAWRIAVSPEHVAVHGPSCAVALALLLEPLLLTRGPAELHRAVLAATIELATAAPDRTHALDAAIVELELCVGKIDVIRGHFRRAIVAIRAALARAERAELPSLVGWCSTALSLSLRPLEAFDEAESCARRALEIAHESRDHRLAAQAEQALATIALTRNEHAAAIEGLHRALACARLANAPRLEAIMLANFAYASLRATNYDEAQRYCASARAQFERRNDGVHLARMAVLEQVILVEAGRAESDTSLLRALDAAVAQGDLEGELEAREALARFAQQQGDAALFAQRVDELAVCAAFTDDFEWPPRVRALQRLARVQRSSRGAMLSLSRRGDRVVLDEKALDFSRRGPLKRVLLALVEAHERGATMSPAQVQSAGWPGERMRAESAAARVYMAIRRLRSLGLGALICTSDAGYSLASSTRVRWLDEPMLADVRRPDA